LAALKTPESRCPVRRSGRQPKRTDKLEEFLMTTKRGSRKSAPPSVESGDPPSQTPTDAETASEASFDGNAESRAAEDKAESPERRTRSSTRKQAQKKTQGGRQTRSTGRAAVKDEGSSENEEDGKDEDQTQDDSEETKDAKPDPGTKATEGAENKVTEETNEPEGETEKETDDEDADTPAVMTRRPVNTAPVKKETKPKAAGKMSKHETTEEEEEDDDDDEESFTTSSSSTSSDEESDDGGYDPNALYCICRQKHNKRFMICCDRCEEWFHGDCVGITEARGRLMERNGEDYICPNCTAKKNQLKLSAGGTGLNPSAVQGAAPFSTASGAEDQGIKGRIEKATNPSGKKKIKIFQPQRAEDDSSLPKCIGPGCDSIAQPDSVYCGNDCILKHAAAAMKSITDVKEPKQKDKSMPQKNKSTAKQQQKFISSSPLEASDSDEDFSPDEDNEDEYAEEQRPPPSTASWSSDHNYIAVTPEKTTPISPTVLNRKCMYLLEGLVLLFLNCISCFPAVCVVPVALTSFGKRPVFLGGEHELICAGEV
uniref:PHD-type domain-containing protein n=1 Tax=Poecilia mexicana TaxID=48701 RepID=A0A3B3YKQ3_9TELE